VKGHKGPGCPVSEQSYLPGNSADLLSIVMLIRAHGENRDVAILVTASSCLPVQLELPGSESVPVAPSPSRWALKGPVFYGDCARRRGASCHTTPWISGSIITAVRYSELT
jgi:hypothetical protein